MAGFTGVIVSDSHLKTTEKWGKITSNGVNSRLLDKLDNLSKSVNYAIEHGVDYWIHAGDVFDKLNASEQLRNLFFKVISPLIGKIPIILIIGNHDTDNKAYNFMSDERLLSLLNSRYIRIVSEITNVKLKGQNVLFIPWVPEADIVKVLKETKDQVVMGHFAVSGARVGPNEYVLSEGISQSLFDHHRYAYLGHYHKHQSTSRWMYIGSLARADFSERNDDKGFLSITVNDETISHKFIDVNDRVFFQCQVNQKEDPTFLTIDKWTTLKDHVVKLVFIGEESWFYSFNLTEIRYKILKKLGADKLIIEHKNTYENRIRVPEISASTSWDRSIEVYCKKKNAENLVELGKTILREVL